MRIVTTSQGRGRAAWVRNARPLFAASAVAALLCSCAPDLAKPIGDFQSSVDSSATALQSYYTDLNRFEREMYVEQCAFDPDTEIGTTGLDGKPTPLLHTVFSPESIKARTDAIQLMGLHAKRLAELAGSDAPQKFMDGSKVLGSNLTGLAKTFEALNESTSDPTASVYVGPVTTLIGVAGSLYLEQKRNAAVLEGVRQGAPAVNAILDQLESDLQLLRPGQLISLKIALSDRVDEYNANRKKWTQEKRLSRLAQIRQVADRYDATVAADPSELVQGIRESHLAIVEFAESKKKDVDYVRLAEALEVFHKRAAIVSTAVIQLRSASIGGKS